jgi:hypothetical protein
MSIQPGASGSVLFQIGSVQKPELGFDKAPYIRKHADAGGIGAMIQSIYDQEGAQDLAQGALAAAGQIDGVLGGVKTSLTPQAFDPEAFDAGALWTEIPLPPQVAAARIDRVVVDEGGALLATSASGQVPRPAPAADPRLRWAGGKVRHVAGVVSPGDPGGAAICSPGSRRRSAICPATSRPSTSRSATPPRR